MQVEDFITRWRASGGSEIANFQTFASELCDILGVDRPKPAQSDGQTNDYRFERPVTETHTGTRRRRRIDLYRRQCFVMEAKQGAGPKAESEQLSLLSAEDAPQGQLGHGRRGTRGFEDTMLRARNQADGYARAISKEDGWPPFLLVVDVAHVIEVYADFSGQGQGYTQFPDGNRYRITLEDLRDDEVRERLRTIWSDPMSLDPSRTAARVTREIADHLAQLGRSFEGQGHEGEDVARFLMRCLFTMFAEDVELLPKDSFRDKLRELRGKPEMAAPVLQSLWETMNTGGTSTVIMAKLLRFNGGLFRDASALPLSEVQLSLLIEAAEADWKQVEPAIFGTLLERALDKNSRHKLGAHYTPRAYVERLVMPTIIEPLRADWRSVQAAADLLRSQSKEKEALREVQGFHRKLCEVTVLDPACGSGNFLYVALELMKRLEGEVIATMEELGETQTNLGLAGYTVDPHQFLGIELNPWAANVAELVLWIGYLQWHYRTHGKAAPSEPILRDFKNIEHRDAVLTWSDRTPRLDENGAAVTRWDGTTTMRHPATGEEVPDPSARVQIYDYVDPRPAAWPEATFIVGNPPFIGARRIRSALTPEYVDALRHAYKGVPRTVDLVMYWWWKAAELTRRSSARRFGLITTNSITQDYSRKLTEKLIGGKKPKIHLIYATTNHPWVDSSDGANVRIAMTVGSATKPARPVIGLIGPDGKATDVRVEKIHARLSDGPDFSEIKALEANRGICFQGVVPAGDGFKLSTGEYESFRSKLRNAEKKFVRKYIIGKDILERPRGYRIIDLFGVDESVARTELPNLYAHLLDRVKPVREENDREQYKRLWWIFAEPRPALRRSLSNTDAYIGTTYTAKHRVFQMVNADILPDAMVYCIALQNAESLAVLSSHVHLTWCKGCTGTLEDRPRYNSANTFSPFPFPDLTPSNRTTLRQLGEELDAHRKERQAQHPSLTLTQMYNTLEKLRAGETIEGKDKRVYEDGLIGLLKDIHDRIDAAVAEAYGWPTDLSENDILMNLVTLNRERVAEEARGHVRWLRPDYQNPDGRAAESKQGKLEIAEVAKTGKAPWPKSLPAQIAAVREALEDLGEADAETVARTFTRGRATTVAPLLETLAGLGMAEMTDEGRYAI
ncbi:DNA methyltransferase [Roseicyclus sp. F158]|uniref:site-specific DNA-methyltransferase (adenine-specific) n=1 Tax=Tropicimonas omnivorans TaxID=3075590 RepID=A0ABU3DF39_9RHOB|nr:DNA methyltransferase [Roseicyclus sp. F158]MDT0682305.1 DNA methyltransferase [Roseicyclus sp. F158]